MKIPFCHRIRSLSEYQDFTRFHADEIQAQRAYEHTLFGGRSEFDVSGFCVACDQVQPLRVDLNWGNGQTPNWRERLQCVCGLNNRIRASLHFLDALLPDVTVARIYATEQVTALFKQLRRRYPECVGSEFLRDGTARGEQNSMGIRHEDVTQLTFDKECFDAVVSFDVLEHVPDYTTALSEITRVLRPGGVLLASFPFDTSKPFTERRAKLHHDGSIEHLLPPEYHGDPVDSSGCLCFQIFGWSVLEDLKNAGFEDAYTEFYWSRDFGYMGPNQLQIIARKSSLSSQQ